MASSRPTSDDVSLADEFRRAVDLQSSRRVVRARRCFEQLALGEGPHRHWAVLEIVQGYLRAGQSEKAETHLRQLLPADSALLLHGLGHLYRLSGRAAEARSWLEEAQRRRPKPWPVDTDLGWLRCVAGDTKGGEKLLRSAARHFESKGDAWGEAVATTLLGTWSFRRWDLGRALALHEKALGLKRRVGDARGEATCLFEMALNRFRCSEFDVARELAESSAELFERIGYPKWQSLALNLLGLIQRSVGNLDAAWDWHQRALRAHRRAGSVALAGNDAIVLGNLMTVAEAQGRFAAARRQGRTALELLAGRPNEEARSNVVRALSRLEVATGNPRRALELLADTTEENTERSPFMELVLSVERARAHLALGEAEEAVSAARAGLALVERGGKAHGSIDVVALEARALLTHGLLGTSALDGARKTLRQAEREMKRLSAWHVLPRAGTTATFRAVEDASVRAATLASARSSRQAWRTARDLKARHLLATIRRAKAEDSPRLRELELRLDDLANRRSPTNAQVTELRRLVREHSDLLERATGARTTLIDGGASTVEALPGHVALLEYHSAAETTWLFAVDADGVRHFDLGLDARQLRRLVERLLAPLHRASRSLDPHRHLDDFDLEAARRAYRRLVMPALKTLSSEVKQLVVIPDGALHDLPFELLVEELSSSAGGFVEYFGGARYLCDSYLLTRCPSSLLLDSRPTRPLRRALAVACSPDDGTTLQLADGPRRLSNLPLAARDVELVSQLVASTTLLRDEQATASSVMTAMPRRDLIHLSAHAFSDETAPGLSGLVLAGGSPGTSALLRAERLAGLSLNAELVTLAACETAAGRLAQGEGTLGLSRSFVAAGARSVLASHWPVDDESAHVLVGAFLREVVQGRSRAEALHVARTELREAARENPLHAHPVSWSAFTLTDRSLPSTTA
ncbi:MAG: CHAT domain-containing protein [Acidobacteriota bacterium]